MKNKNGRVAYLCEHMVEDLNHPYKTRHRLVLIGENLIQRYSGYWDLNKGNTQAVPELKEAGWEVCDD